MPAKTGIRPMFVCLPGDKSPTDHILTSRGLGGSGVRGLGAGGSQRQPAHIQAAGYLWLPPLSEPPNPEPPTGALNYHPSQ